MNGVITVTLQPRGQITLPKKFRDYWGVVGGAILKTSLKEDQMIVEPLEDKDETIIIKPTISRQEYLEALKAIAKSGKVLWTKADDRKREESLKKEREKWKKLNW